MAKISFQIAGPISVVCEPRLENQLNGFPRESEFDCPHHL